MVLAPEDGAGSGFSAILKSDTIIDIEGGGISTCGAELIESFTINESGITPTPTAIIYKPERLWSGLADAVAESDNNTPSSGKVDCKIDFNPGLPVANQLTVEVANNSSSQVGNGWVEVRYQDNTTTRTDKQDVITSNQPYTVFTVDLEAKQVKTIRWYIEN